MTPSLKPWCSFADVVHVDQAAPVFDSLERLGDCCLSRVSLASHGSGGGYGAGQSDAAGQLCAGQPL